MPALFRLTAFVVAFPHSPSAPQPMPRFRAPVRLTPHTMPSHQALWDLLTPLSLPRRVRSMFIQTEQTPNPDSLKFLPGKQVLDAGSRDFRSFRDAQISPLAKKLFQMDGVSGVFLSTDFITVRAHSRHIAWMPGTEGTAVACRSPK